MKKGFMLKKGSSSTTTKKQTSASGGNGGGGGVSGYAAYARDQANAARLWAFSEKALGEAFVLT